MRKFRDRVAVVTGAASGIGLGLAKKCVQEGMKVVLADVEAASLEKAEAELKSKNGNILAIRTDVSREEDVRNLAHEAIAHFGSVHLLFNNAGVEVRGVIWEQTPEDWKWILGVNLWGVINGIRTFVPIMLDQGTQCHIVNTVSAAAFISGPGLGSYRVTKSAILSLSETLYHELKARAPQVGVSIIYPSFVRSRLIEAERNRPAEFQKTETSEILSEADQEQLEFFQKKNREGMPPSLFAEKVFEGIREDKFYIQTHPEINQWARMRMEDMLQTRNPKGPSM